MAEPTWGQDDEEVWGADDPDASDAIVGAAATVEPFKYTPRYTVLPGIGPVSTEPPENEKLAKQGVDIRTPAPKGLETGKRAFSPDEGMWADYANARLQELIPGSEYKLIEGVPTWYNPKTKLWTKMEDSSTGQGLLRILGENLTTIGSGASMLGPQGRTASAVIGLSAAKAGGGVGIMEMTRRAIGRAMGVNTETISKMMKESAGEGLEAANWDVAGGAAAVGAKYVKETIKGRPVMPPELAEELLNDIGQYQNLIDEIGGLADNVPLHATAGADSFAARAAQRLWQDAEQAGGDVGMEIARRNDAMNTALRQHIEKASQPFDVGIPADAGGRYEAGLPMQQGIQKEMQDGMTDRANMATADALRAENAAMGMPAGGTADRMSAGARVREQMWAQAQQAKAVSDQAYEEFRFSVGMSPDMKSPHRVTIKDPATLRALQRHAFNRETGELVAGNKMHRNADGSWSVDLGTLWRSSQRARARVRQKKNPDILDEDTQRSEELITSAMHDFIKKGSADGSLPPDSFKKLMEADAQYAAYKRKWEEGFRADFLEQTAGGKWKIKDQDLLRSILRGRDVEAAMELKDVIKSDPVAMNEVRKVLLGIAGRASANLKTGTPSAAKLNKFMDDEGYRPIIEMFFDKKTYGQIDTLTDLANAAERSAKDLKKAQAVLRAKFGTKFTKMEPEEFARHIFTRGTKVKDAQDLVWLSQRYPDAYEALQNGVANEIKMALMPNGPTGGMEFTKLTKMLEDFGPKIEAVMGHRYVLDLQAVSRVLPLIKREAAGTGAPATMNRFQSLVRGVVRPFSREGNILAWLGKNRGDNISPQVLQILTDRDSLRELANYSRNWLDMTKIAAGSAAAGSQLVGQEGYRD